MGWDDSAGKKNLVDKNACWWSRCCGAQKDKKSFFSSNTNHFISTRTPSSPPSLVTSNTTVNIPRIILEHPPKQYNLIKKQGYLASSLGVYSSPL